MKPPLDWTKNMATLDAGCALARCHSRARWLAEMPPPPPPPSSIIPNIVIAPPMAAPAGTAVARVPVRDDSERVDSGPYNFSFLVYRPGVVSLSFSFSISISGHSFLESSFISASFWSNLPSRLLRHHLESRSATPSGYGSRPSVQFAAAAADAAASRTPPLHRAAHSARA